LKITKSFKRYATIKVPWKLLKTQSHRQFFLLLAYVSKYVRFSKEKTSLTFGFNKLPVEMALQNFQFEGEHLRNRIL